MPCLPACFHKHGSACTLMCNGFRSSRCYHLPSSGRFGATAFLCSMYGVSELPQVANPIQSNPIQSNPIRSKANPIQSKPSNSIMPVMLVSLSVIQQLLLVALSFTMHACLPSPLAACLNGTDSPPDCLPRRLSRCLPASLKLLPACLPISLKLLAGWLAGWPVTATGVLPASSGVWGHVHPPDDGDRTGGRGRQ